MLLQNMPVTDSRVSECCSNIDDNTFYLGAVHNCQNVLKRINSTQWGGRTLKTLL